MSASHMSKSDRQATGRNVEGEDDTHRTTDAMSCEDEHGAVQVADMVVPGNQVTNFTDTLRGLSLSCKKSHEAAEAAAKTCGTVLRDAEAARDAAKRDEEAMTAQCKEVWNRVKGASDDMEQKNNTAMCKLTDMGKRLEGVLEKIEEEKKELEKEKFVVQELVETAGEHCRETRRIVTRVQLKENMICSYAETVRESETLTALQYKRALYASTLCKELAKSALGSLDGALTLLKRVTDMNVRNVQSGKDDGTDNRNEERMVDSESANADVNDESKALESIISELVENVRFLRTDVSDMERSAKMLEEVGFVEDILRITSGEFADCSGLCMDRRQLEQKRSRICNLVRTSMPYDDSVYGSKSEYERAVVVETSRKMKLSDRNSSSLLTGVVQTLKESGVDRGGAIPKDFKEVFENDGSARTSFP